MPSGPIIEELPDDFDVAAHRKEASSSSSGALRRGFLTSRQSGTNAAEPAPPPTESPEQALGAPSAHSKQEEQKEEAHEPSCTLEGLRKRLQRCVEDAKAQQQHRQQQAEADRTNQAESIETALAALQARWPTSSMKEKQTKASKEIDTGLAEIRAAFNDSRRRRSGEDRKALSALKIAAEDAISRVQKAADGADANKGSTEERRAGAVAAFHALPLTAKLRILVVEKKAAAVLLGGSFFLGTLGMLGICLEIYTAWGCRLQCT